MTSIFENQKISPEQLPEVNEHDFVPLDPAYKRYLFLVYSLTTLFLVAGAVAFQYFSRGTGVCMWVYVLVYVLVLLFFIFNTLLINAGFPLKGYLLREHDLIYRSGYLVRKITAIPKNRIQHVEIRQGAIARMFGISKLLIYTAGGSRSDLSVPGLLPEVAQQLKEHLTLSISKHE
ncbi:MAG: PH domain-containing protein [Chlorobi bacterium]|nr:PH domain-containing protein [Chlorobiota bacterium]